MNQHKFRGWRTTTSIVAISALTLGLSACSDGGDADSAGTDDQVTIEVWDYLGQGVSDEAMNEVVANFEDENPDISVNRTSFAYADLSKSIVQGGVAGEVPDVAIVDVVDNQNFAALGLLAESDGGVAGDFFEGPWSSTQFDDKTYGYPLNSNNLALYYNEDLFAEAGLQPPTTWDELADVSEQLTNDDHTGLAISAVKSEQGTFQFLPFVWQTGGDLDTYETSGAEALAFLKGMIDDGSMSSAVANYTQEDARTQFVGGKVAMMINGPWELQNLREAEDLNFGVTALPAGQRAATGMGGENVVVFAGAEQAEAGQRFAEYLTSAEGAKTYCNISGQLSAREDLTGELELSADPQMQVFEKQLEVAHARAYGSEYSEISVAVQESLQRALTGEASPEVAAKDAAEKITPLLEN